MLYATNSGFEQAMERKTERPQDSPETARERADSQARMLAELNLLLDPRARSAALRPRIGSSHPDVGHTDTLDGREYWEDGRPKGWPTLQLRVRGKPFDIYCEDASDVTLDGIGIPVVNGLTVSHEDRARGWFSVWDAPGRLKAR